MKMLSRLLFALLLTWSVAACGGDDGGGGETDTGQTADTAGDTGAGDTAPGDTAAGDAVADAGPTVSAECTLYCSLVDTHCTGDDAVDFGADGCEAACAGYSHEGTDGDAGGDTVQCRIYHADAPAAGDPATHCPHAAPDGGGVCVD